MSAAPPPSATTEDPNFAISAVAKLTGISEHCLRIWERRYQVVEPARTETKRRRYTHQDVERLVLIKHLVDSGDTISSVAALDLAQLQERSRHYPSASQSDDAAKKIGLAIIGERITTFLDHKAMTAARLEVKKTYATVSDFLNTIPRPKVEVIVFDFATVHLQTISDIEEVLLKSGARKAILVYGFAARPALERLDRNRVVPLRAPVDPHEIRIACADPHMIATTHEITPAESSSKIDYIPHRYNVDQLARLASLSTKVDCECPQHLVSLVFELNAFEKYSSECSNLNQKDAELHSYLHNMTSRARSIIEEALAKAAAADGIEVLD